MLTFCVSHISARVLTSCFFLTSYHKTYFSLKILAQRNFLKTLGLLDFNGRIQFLLDHLKKCHFMLLLSCYESLTKSLTPLSFSLCLKPSHCVYQGCFFLIAHILFYQSNYFFSEPWGHRPEILLLGGAPICSFTTDTSLSTANMGTFDPPWISPALGSCG